jgi:hypothetical protein
MQHKQSTVFFTLLLLSVFTVSGQKQVNSPYSRFNIGKLEPQGPFKSQSMGGAGTAMHDNTSIFYTNPASYSNLDTTSFVFDFGFDYSMNSVTKDNTDYFSDDLNFDHLLMGFPVMKGWGVAIGVVPVSNGYYKMFDIVAQGSPDYDPITGAYSSFFSGEGSLSNFILGTGFHITKDLSVGANMTVLFGNLGRKYAVDFSDFYNSFNNSAEENIQLGGINFDMGIQYTKLLKNDYFFSAGLSGTLGHNYNTNYERYSYSYTAYGNRDTISYVVDDVTKTYIPGSIRAGLAMGKKNKFTAAFDFTAAEWNESVVPGINGYAANTKSFHFGMEYIPEKYSNFSFLRRIEYRAGTHYGDNYVIVDGEQVKEFGLSFGLGIPMGLSLSDKRSLSRSNFMFDYTKSYGSGNLHNENYFTFGLSFNFYDFWFVKRKYD